MRTTITITDISVSDNGVDIGEVIFDHENELEKMTVECAELVCEHPVVLEHVTLRWKMFLKVLSSLAKRAMQKLK